MLGAGVDPRLFSYDFSGAYKIGENYAQAIQGIGQSIAKGIEGFQEKKKEQATIERQIKKADNVAKAIADLVPDLAPTIEASRAQLMDLNLPQNDRLAIAEGIGDILNIGLAEVKGRQERASRNQELAMKYAPEPPEPIKAVGNPFKVRMQADGQEVDVEHVRLNDGRMVPLYEYQQMQRSEALSNIGNVPTSPYVEAIDRGEITLDVDGKPMPNTLLLPTSEEGAMVLPELGEIPGNEADQIASLIGQPGVTVVEPKNAEQKGVEYTLDEVQKLQDQGWDVSGVPTKTGLRATTIKYSPKGKRVSAIDERIQVLTKAKELSEKGDKAGAALLLNALRYTQPIIGGMVTPENIDEMFLTTGEQPSEESNVRQPIGNILD